MSDEQIAVLFDLCVLFDRAIAETVAQIVEAKVRLEAAPIAGPERNRELELLAHLGRQLENLQQIYELVNCLRLETGDMLEFVGEN